MPKASPGEGNINDATLAQTYGRGLATVLRIGCGGCVADRHLSTGPIWQAAGQDPVMFYNGATHDARWRIGWISFSPDFAQVTGRGLEPLLVPPPALSREATDIAFAASTVAEGDRIALYYSLEDRMLRRALIGRYAR